VRFFKFLRDNFVLLALIALIVVFSSAYPDKFWSRMNLSSIVRQFLRLSLFALGPTIVIITGSMDLSYIGIWMLGGILTWYLHSQVGPLAILVYPLIGALTGLITGFLQVKGKIPSFILTLSITVTYWGITAWMSGGYPRVVRGYRFITASIIPFFPAAFFWALPLMFFVIFLMHRTRIGTYFYAIGSNEEGARVSGIDVEKYRILAFTLSGLITGTGMIILFPLMGGSVPTELKLGSLIDPLIAIVLGGTSLAGGVGSPAKAMLGAITFAVIQRGISLTFWKPELIQLILGLIVLGAILTGTRRLRGMIVK